MKPRSIGIVAGGGGPLGASYILKGIIDECQRSYASSRSYEYPALNLYSYPYSEMLLADSPSPVPERELSHAIQQLKLNGMEIVVVPCFTMSSYLTYRTYGVELVEMGAVLKKHLASNNIHEPMVLCSARTRKSGYCDKFFKCRYPDEEIQREINLLGEEALRGQMVDLSHVFSQLPDVPILVAFTVLNAQSATILDRRWINANTVLCQHVVERSFTSMVPAKCPVAEKKVGYLPVRKQFVLAS